MTDAVRKNLKERPPRRRISRVAGKRPGTPNAKLGGWRGASERARRQIPVVVASVLSFTVGVVGSFAVERFAPRLLAPLQSVFSPLESLYVHETYPLASCTGPDAAVYEYRREELAGPDDSADPMTLINAGKGVPYQRAALRLTLSTAYRDDKIQLLDITPVVYRYREVAPAWIAQPDGGGCGDALQRTFNLSMTTGEASIQDLGVQGSGDVSRTVPVNGLGTTFVITQDDTYDISIDVSADDGIYEFGLILHYALEGSEFEHRIGTADDPYVLGGGTATDHRVTIGRAGDGTT